MSTILDLGDHFFFKRRQNGWDADHSLPFSGSLHLLPLTSEIGGKICQRNLTRIDRTIQKCSARRIDFVVSDLATMRRG